MKSRAEWKHACVGDEGTPHPNMHAARYHVRGLVLLATADIYATPQLLGHADVSTTANIYVPSSPADPPRSSGRSGARQ
jgi:site-specific recombinase XerC